ncbi:hypothetical protein KSF73_01835 [Burkholderiaceae bacterium DAT-1]|nr:hypothetical protein [Burkholderiaceae bacterium DAT-1]
MRDPILCDYPETIDTPYQHMRLARKGDGPLLYQALLELFEQNLQPDAPINHHRPSQTGVEAACREAHAEWILRERLLLLSFDRQTGELTCSVGLQNMRWLEGVHEISLWTRPAWKNSGRLSDALMHLVAYSFMILNARRLSCVVPASQTTLCESLLLAGLREESVLQDYYPNDAGVLFGIGRSHIGMR